MRSEVQATSIEDAALSGEASSARSGVTPVEALLGLLAAFGALRLLQTVLFAIRLPNVRLTGMLWVFGASGIFLGISALYVRRSGQREVWSALGLKDPQVNDFAVGVPVGVGLFFGTMWLQGVINQHFAGWVGQYVTMRTVVGPGSGPWLFAGALQALLVPIGEEALYRGLLYTGLRQKYSIVPAVALSAALFAVFHIDPAIMPGIFVDGVVLALAFEWRRTLAMPIVIHSSILVCFLVQSSTL